MAHPFTARRTHGFTESVIRGMTRLAAQHDAINLAQGFPNFAPPAAVVEGAVRAMRDGVHQYAVTWGAPRLRRALAVSWATWYGQDVDPDTEITVTCGATEAMAAVFLACLNPGDEVVIFEPFYENYGPDAILCGATPVFVPMPVTGPLDLDRVRAAIGPRTRAMVLNTPNNPTGRVLDREALGGLAGLCTSHDLLAITDEIYEHIIFDGEHVPISTFPGMRERTVTISGASKTFSVTGWRIGTILAPAGITDAIRKVHDFLTVGAPAPLQEGVAAGLEELPPTFYRELAEGYRARRDLVVAGLQGAGFTCTAPAGAYYVLADFRALSRESDVAFARRLTSDWGVAPVPGSSFFASADAGRRLVRFAFCKTDDLLREAMGRLADLPGGLAAAGEP